MFHELGHMLGLKHETNTGNFMAAKGENGATVSDNNANVSTSQIKSIFKDFKYTPVGQKRLYNQNGDNVESYKKFIYQANITEL